MKPDYVYIGPDPLGHKEMACSPALGCSGGAPSAYKPEKVAMTAGKTAPKFDKVAYQREYMRKRRAKAKDAG